MTDHGTAPALEATVARVTEQICQRSQHTRTDYVQRMQAARRAGPHRGALSCGNVAHGFAACVAQEKQDLSDQVKANIAIVSAYNDMLSAHQPLRDFPERLKAAVAAAGGVAQFAGGVPAMCDGVTQGQPGMELSLFSRDVIAQATAIALSHNMFDGALYLGVCDKIVPGLLIGALSFGHLPGVFVPAGPMPSGLPNAEKAAVRQKFAQGLIGRDALLEAESQSYHSPGTCTFYGTANSNQMLMEMMGLQAPGGSFINPGTAERDVLTDYAGQRITALTDLGETYTPLYEVVDERAIVNGMVGLLATGGSTNHTIHLITIARAAGVVVTWDDFAALSTVVPLLCRMYPNGQADVNQFHAAGGMGFVIAQLLNAGLLHADVTTIAGPGGLWTYARDVVIRDGQIGWRAALDVSGDEAIVRSVARPFSSHGGLKVVSGNLGRAVVKVSAVQPEHWQVEAPALVFEGQQDFMQAFEAGNLQRDFVAVVRYQGPQANGMPELHKLTPPLAVLQMQGFRVALVTDGRMSGASGQVLAAIHVCPEARDGGALARIQDGDLVRLDAVAGTLDVLCDTEAFAARPVSEPGADGTSGLGRELFSGLRQRVSAAEAGATVLFAPLSSAPSSDVH